MPDRQPIPTIRQLTSADLPAVRRLYAQLSADTSNLDRDLPAMLADANSLAFLAEVDGTPVGILLGYVRCSLSAGRKMILDDMVVDHDHRRLGFGRMLVRHCLALAARRGLDCVELACSPNKPRLHEFYEHLGFRSRMVLYSVFLQDVPRTGPALDP